MNEEKCIHLSMTMVLQEANRIMTYFREHPVLGQPLSSGQLSHNTLLEVGTGTAAVQRSALTQHTLLEVGTGTATVQWSALTQHTAGGRYWDSRCPAVSSHTTHCWRSVLGQPLSSGQISHSTLLEVGRVFAKICHDFVALLSLAHER